MFNQTAQNQMNDVGHNSSSTDLSSPQVIQPSTQPMSNYGTPPSGMTRVPMTDDQHDWSSSQVADPSPKIQSQSSSTLLTPATDSPSDSGSNPLPSSEKLEDQNIFYMLGVTDGTEEQKNQFLDELQQVIWEDFLDEDVKLLLTQEEQSELDRLKAAKPDAKLEEQEEVIVYLEKLIPDLEDILLEKALELKADLMKERVAGMRELYKDKQDVLMKIDQADQLMVEEKWLSAAKTLNSILV